MNPTAEPTVIDREREDEILDYLRAHPDFLQRHEAILEELAPPDAAPGTASLSLYQLRHSRKRIHELEQQLARLIGVAKDNERLLTRMHQLTLDLGGAENPAEFMQRLEQLLRERFELDQFTLVIPDHALSGLHNPHIRRPASDHQGILRELLDHPVSISGRLTQRKATALFGDPEAVGSAAIAPIPDFGLLAVASHDVNRFAPDAGVMFLSLVGASLRHYLEHPGEESPEPPQVSELIAGDPAS